MIAKFTQDNSHDGQRVRTLQRDNAQLHLKVKGKTNATCTCRGRYISVQDSITPSEFMGILYSCINIPKYLIFLYSGFIFTNRLFTKV